MALCRNHALFLWIPCTFKLFCMAEWQKWLAQAGMCRIVLCHIDSVVCEAKFQCQPLAVDSLGGGKTKEKPKNRLGQAGLSSFPVPAQPPLPVSLVPTSWSTELKIRNEGGEERRAVYTHGEQVRGKRQKHSASLYCLQTDLTCIISYDHLCSICKESEPQSYEMIYLFRTPVNKYQIWGLNLDLLAPNPLFFIQKTKTSASTHTINLLEVYFFSFRYTMIASLDL